MKKEVRIKVWEKYDGHCAYCGKKIKYNDMQVDHYYPRLNGRVPKDISDKLHNLMPSCRRCNHYKRSYYPEDFRALITKLPQKIGATYLAKVAVDYGIIEFNEFEGKFYFERISVPLPGTFEQ